MNEIIISTSSTSYRMQICIKIFYRIIEIRNFLMAKLTHEKAGNCKISLVV